MSSGSTRRQPVRPIAAVAVAALAFLASVLPARTARADGFIVVHEPPTVVPGHFPLAPLEVAYHRVEVSIDDRVATTSVDQEFRNPNNARMEGTYLFPLPDGAALDKFSMDIDGTEMEAELLPADRARSIYEDIVRRSRDPALMEYVGRGALKVRIFPIEPNSKKRVRLKYTQVLGSDSGLTEYVYPLNTEKFSSRPLDDVSVRVKLACGQPLKSVYSPSHSVDITRDGDRRATVGYEEKNARPDTDFKLIFSTDADPVGLDLLTYKDSSGGDGYFMLLASPGVDASPGQAQPRDVCFVLDTSGSMAGPKLEQAKKALRFCLANLNAGDRFEIVRFSTEAEPLFDKLVPADAEHLARAESFVKDLKPIGGTAIGDAIDKAMALSRSADARPYVVIFLTDGQPTVGETREDAIVSLVKNRARDAKVFSFGIGTDINTHLLDRVASETKAFSQYVLPEEDIELKVSSFYTKIKEPALANVKLDFAGGAGGVRVSEVYPSAMPDLYKGQTLVAFGRYRGDGAGAVRLAGTLAGERREFADDVTFTASDTRHAFIQRLWATRRVGWLLDEIRLRGESAEVRDEIVRLAREHGIVTPYTAYLILEDEARRNVPMTSRSFRELELDGAARGAVSGQYQSAPADSMALEKSGARAVQNAQAAESLKQSENESMTRQDLAMAKRPGGLAAGGSGGAGGPGAAAPEPGYRARTSYAQQVRVVRGKAFYQNGPTWTDSTAQAKQNLKRRDVAFNSDDYFALVRQYPDAAQWLSLGNEVDVVIGDTLYQVR